MWDPTILIGKKIDNFFVLKKYGGRNLKFKNILLSFIPIGSTSSLIHVIKVE